MKKILSLFVLLTLMLAVPAQAYVVSFGSLNGGGVGALEAISCLDVDGNSNEDADGDGLNLDPLTTGDRAIGTDNGSYYIYVYNAESTALVDDLPEVIVPDDQAGGTGAWERAGISNITFNVADELADTSDNVEGDIGFDPGLYYWEVFTGTEVIQFAPIGAIDTEAEFEALLFALLTPSDNIESMATAGGSGTAPVSGGAGAVSMVDITTQAEFDAARPYQKDFVITSPADADDVLLFKAQNAMTITPNLSDF